jgi:hypothetical protein
MMPSAAIQVLVNGTCSENATAELTFVPSLIPTLIHRPCVKRGFDCAASALAYPVFQMLWFGFVGNGSAG